MIPPVLRNATVSARVVKFLQGVIHPVPAAVAGAGAARLERPVDSALLEAAEAVLAEGAGAFQMTLSHDPAGQLRILRPSFGDVAMAMLPQKGVERIAEPVPVALPVPGPSLRGPPPDVQTFKLPETLVRKLPQPQLPALIDDPERKTGIRRPVAGHVAVTVGLLEFPELLEPRVPLPISGVRGTCLSQRESPMKIRLFFQGDGASLHEAPSLLPDTLSN
jgi:hypothetical protein